MKKIYILILMFCLNICLSAQGALVVLLSESNTVTTQTGDLLVIGTLGNQLSGVTATDDLLISTEPPPLLLTEEITGVQDLPLIEGLEVFPNPFISIVQLQCKNAKDDLIISVTGTNGIHIATYDWKQSDDEFQFSLQHLPAGLYVIRVTENGGARASQFKLVKR